MTLAQRLDVEVTQQGELVTLTIGNIARAMHFEDALRLSGRMLFAGRTARRVAGISGRHERVSGSLTALEDAKNTLSRFSRSHETLTSKVDAWDEGAVVAVKIDETTARMGWEAALQISQWLRIRGKEARNTVNETAHWAQIAGLPQENGK